MENSVENIHADIRVYKVKVGQLIPFMWNEDANRCQSNRSIPHKNNLSVLQTIVYMSHLSLAPFLFSASFPLPSLANQRQGKITIVRPLLE